MYRTFQEKGLLMWGLFFLILFLFTYLTIVIIQASLDTPLSILWLFVGLIISLIIEKLPIGQCEKKMSDNENKREWVVFSTCLSDGSLMLECAKTGALGIVRNPTREEWNKAFDAPDNPYRWQGGD